MREGSWDQAREIAERSFAALPAETVRISHAVGRTTASDLHSLCDLPAYATSSMDGWAVSGNAPWKVIGEVATGRKSDQKITSGLALKISTGGVIPDGSEAVIPWEAATIEGDQLSGVIEPGANIRPAALEAKSGDLLIPAGTRLTPPMVGLLAATGHDSVPVRSKPRIAIFFLGDELIHSGVPEGGAIRDALGPQLPALLESCGAEVLVAEFIKDDLPTVIETAKAALTKVDLIITTGGTADGPRDYVKPTIEALGGDYLIDCARVRPGYHILIAALHDGARELAFIALPGNPQSALAALTSFAIPVIDSLLGRAPEKLSEVALGSAMKTPENFSRLVPGNIVQGTFTPTEYLNSAMLRGVAQAEGFAVIAPGAHEKGSQARWLPFNF